jgi:hypothetical protein
VKDSIPVILACVLVGLLDTVTGCNPCGRCGARGPLEKVQVVQRSPVEPAGRHTVLVLHSSNCTTIAIMVKFPEAISL